MSKDNFSGIEDGDELVPELVRKTINHLNEKLMANEEYIKILEEKVNTLQEKLYYIERNKHMEKVVDEAIVNHNVEEGLKKMGIEEEDLSELSDLLEEVIKKESNKEEDER